MDDDEDFDFIEDEFTDEGEINEYIPKKLTFKEALKRDWENHGTDVVARLREKHPETYTKIYAQLLERQDKYTEETLVDVLIAVDRRSKERGSG